MDYATRPYVANRATAPTVPTGSVVNRSVQDDVAPVPSSEPRSWRRQARAAGYVALAGWAALVIVLVGSLEAAHAYTLPRPRTEDQALAAAVARARLPNERGVYGLHVLYTACRCSTRILAQLEQRSPIEGGHETVLLVGQERGHAHKLTARGFRVSVLTPGELGARFGLQAAPLLIVADADQRLRYVGGYTDRKQGAVLRDREILSAAQAERQLRELPVFGCAVSRALQQLVDPFGLQAYASDEARR